MRNHYDLLNVDSDADRESIKRAFYRLAKRFHPDVSKESKNFLKILNAYKTLTDDNKREYYDSTLTGVEGSPAGTRSIILPNDRVWFAVSLRDVARRRYFRPEGSRRKGHMRKLKGYDVCINLTQEELHAGASVFIDAPAHVICPLCGGHHTHCDLCADRGYVVRAVPVQVQIPKVLSDSDVFTIPLKRMRGREFAFFLIKELSVKIKIFQG
jgi:DnaJ-class molecular chaperone